MKNKQVNYQFYFTIAYDTDGFNAFCGFTPIFTFNLPNIHRTKIAIDLWIKFHMNPIRFWKYVRHLLITNRHNYSGCYGKRIPMARLKQIARGA